MFLVKIQNCSLLNEKFKGSREEKQAQEERRERKWEKKEKKGRKERKKGDFFVELRVSKPKQARGARRAEGAARSGKIVQFLNFCEKTASMKIVPFPISLN